jgi:hypothetical protein
MRMRRTAYTPAAGGAAWPWPAYDARNWLRAPPLGALTQKHRGGGARCDSGQPRSTGWFGGHPATAWYSFLK